MTKPTPDQLLGKVGLLLGTSDWVVVDQQMIDKFADATGDYQFIHVDQERALSTAFGGTVAHGFLTLSLLAKMRETTEGVEVDGVKMGINYGIDKVRFIAPVRSGKRVRGHFTLVGLVEKRPGQWQQVHQVTVEIDGEQKPALIAEWITQFVV